METLGKKLLRWRTRRKLSQAKAARLCGLTPQHWWLIENDRRADPELETLERLAAGTKLRLNNLVQAAAWTRLEAKEQARLARRVQAPSGGNSEAVNLEGEHGLALVGGGGAH